MHEKSRPGHSAKKSGKSIKEKRAAKRAKEAAASPHVEIIARNKKG